MGPFRPGAAFLAIARQAPVVPVRIVGAYDILPQHRNFPSLTGRLRVHFGKPLLPPRDRPGTLAEGAFTESIRAAVAELVDD
jgi:1-acyl-sn-glycerol-3-phosphate acyltransferase